ncbi:universal stress protein [Pseudomonas gingeri]|uniref:universal stress protein n=1 Tax=Pseudomonas gingeri TaxID=117681 RepID=UPI0015A2F05B|nr:universal stress protein [Pseudomonas gingeri]NWA09451.1 universal stress protein [Pseudomonas gingeri]
MSNYQRILLVTDPCCRPTPALYRAKALAKACGASLHLVVFDHVEAISALTVFNKNAGTLAREGYLAKKREQLAGLAHQLSGQGMQTSYDLIWSQHPHVSIREYAEDIAVDLVVKDMKVESQLKCALIGPTDWHLVRECSKPVMLVKGDAPYLPKKMLAAVALDPVGEAGTTRDDQVIRLASELAMICAAELDLVHACDILAGYELMQEYPWDSDIAAALQKKRSQDFDDLAGRHQVPGRHRHFLLGPTVERVEDFVRENDIDTLVIGRSEGYAFPWLGSFAETLLSQPACSILTLGAGAR